MIDVKDCLRRGDMRSGIIGDGLEREEMLVVLAEVVLDRKF